ncbi:MAG: B12-binding domain-containing radical SAM protein [Opitutales bacterium]
MRILLVYPEFPATYWSFSYALKFLGKKSAFPPLGLITIAAMLPDDWKIRLVDMNTRRLKNRDLQWADAVFVSAMIVQRDSTREVIDRAKKADTTVVGGGPLFMCQPEDFPDADHLIMGEAETSLRTFLDDWAEGSARPVYEAGPFPSMECVPIPRYDLLDLRNYASLSLQFTRGCPFDCDFCNVTALFGHRPRLKSTQQIIAELDAIHELGWRDAVFFVDDNFIGNKRFLKRDLLPALIEWQRNHRGIPLYTEASINLADDKELMELMSEAGFDTVFVGLETPSEEGLLECNKKQNAGRDLVASVQTIQSRGLQVQGGFIVGFDSDPPNIFQRQIDFIQNSGIVMAMVGILQAPPGTALYRRMKELGRLRGSSSGDNAGGATNIVPKMPLAQLLEGYRSIFRDIYSPAPYYARVRTFLSNYRCPKVRAPLTPSRLMAFLRSAVRLGVIGRERFHYWALLAWTFRRNPKLVPVAVKLAISGYHFRRVYERQSIPSQPGAAGAKSFP